MYDVEGQAGKADRANLAHLEQQKKCKDVKKMKVQARRDIHGVEAKNVAHLC